MKRYCCALKSFQHSLPLLEMFQSFSYSALTTISTLEILVSVSKNVWGWAKIISSKCPYNNSPRQRTQQSALISSFLEEPLMPIGIEPSITCHSKYISYSTIYGKRSIFPIWAFNFDGRTMEPLLLLLLLFTSLIISFKHSHREIFWYHTVFLDDGDIDKTVATCMVWLGSGSHVILFLKRWIWRRTIDDLCQIPTGNLTTDWHTPALSYFSLNGWLVGWTKYGSAFHRNPIQLGIEPKVR